MIRRHNSCFENKSPSLAKKKANLFGRARQSVLDFPLDHPLLGHVFQLSCGGVESDPCLAIMS